MFTKFKPMFCVKKSQNVNVLLVFTKENSIVLPECKSMFYLAAHGVKGSRLAVIVIFVVGL